MVGEPSLWSRGRGKLGLGQKAGARVLALVHRLSLVLTLVARDLEKRNGIEALWLP